MGKTYLFRTAASMKEYNRDAWWIDRDYIRQTELKAESLKEAVEKYREEIARDYYVEISKTAMKNKQKMYRDRKDGGAVWAGYVFTAKTEFQKDSGDWVAQYIELWVDIDVVTPCGVAC